MRFLLDTNILTDSIRNPRGPVAKRMEQEYSEICTNIVVAGELRYGSEKRNAHALARKINDLLERMPVLSLAPPCDHTYAQVRSHLEQVGTPISGNDLFIAAHALALGYTLVTDNEREFARVPNLKVENWLR